MRRIQCERCGMEWTVNTVRRSKILCASCRARKVQTVHTSQGKCYPWHGMFAADEITPIDSDGKPVLPGVRGCGNNDCINASHIIGLEKG